MDNKTISLTRVKTITYLFLILLLGSSLRFHNIGDRELWYDELYSIDLANKSLMSNITYYQVNHPPLYQVILHFWVKLFGCDKSATRSLSVIFGIASIFMVYKVASVLFDSKVGLLSAFLTAVSSFQIFYSSETRDYAMFGLLTLISFFFLIRALENKKIKFYLLYFITTVLLYYAHNYAVFVVFSQNLYFILSLNRHKPIVKRWILIQVSAFLIYAAWIPSLIKLTASVKRDFWVPMPYIKDIFDTFREYIGYNISKYIGSNANNKILFVLFTILLIALLFHKREKQERLVPLMNVNRSLLLALWLLGPIFMPFIISKFFIPIYVTRYTICASFAFYIILAIGMAYLGKET